MIIAIEGMDAAGKKTQSEMLAATLAGARFSFPNYDSPTGKLLLAHLKKEWFCAEDDDDSESVQYYRQALGDVDARVFQSLQAVNRLEVLPSIQALRAQGTHIVFDRYWQSGYVYGSIDGLDEEWLRLVQEKPMPAADINILIDVPVEEGFKRRPERRDRYESNRPFLEKVRQGYLQLWFGFPGLVIPQPDNWRHFEYKPGWHVINGLGTVDDVHASIYDIVDRARTFSGSSHCAVDGCCKLRAPNSVALCSEHLNEGV